MPTKSKTNDRHPGGRPLKANKSEYGQITCVLKLSTIEQLKAGSGSKHFGEYLQHFFDRHPLPTREQYLAMRNSTPYYTLIKRKRVPTLMASGSLPKAAKKLAKEKARRERLSPEERAWEDSIREAVTKTVEATYQ